MVTIPTPPGDPKESSAPANSTETSPTQSVQFSPSSHGLPGGDMQLGKVHGAPNITDIKDSEELGLGSSGRGPILAITAPSTSDQTEIVPTGPPLDENNHKYVGLVNQAMTCYLNSLVQSLYMTPEFRNAMYHWEYRSQKGSADASIPCQIQKLFLQLQTTDKDSMETKELTSSFGWHSNEAYDQHDVQELCRLMFDALEHKWKGSDQEKLIQQLYRGSMQDFVQCLACKKENVRPDFFLDLPLAVKPFGASEAFKSVEEALRAFVAPELLSGSNQYYCENCKSKQDAHKGLRVTSFPYLLTIQLKRFDFDYNTMHRIKLNDKMTFPDVLNLNEFVHDSNTSAAAEMDHDDPVKDINTTHVGQPIDRVEVKRLLKQGPYIYELFSVMVHQGSAAGGHYFAYIKNMQQDRWYCFNDTRVESASTSEIERSFGGSSGGWSSSNTNAYMLMYRKIESNPHREFLPTNQLPKHILSLQNIWNQQAEEKERQLLYQQSLVHVNVRLNMACENEMLLHNEYKFDIPRTQPLADLFNMAHKHFEERCKEHNISFPRNNTRLIRFEGRKMSDVYISKADLSKKIESCLYSPYSSDLSFLFDVKLSNACAFVIIPNQPGRTVAVSRVDIEKRAVHYPFLLHVMSEQKIVQVKSLIGSVLGDSQSDAVSSRLVLERANNMSDAHLWVLDTPGANFNDQLKGIFCEIPRLYYDGGMKQSGGGVLYDDVVSDRKKPLTESVMFELLERKKYAMQIRILLPDDDAIKHAVSATTAFSQCGPSWEETRLKSIPETSPISANDISMASSPSSSTVDVRGSPMSCCDSDDLDRGSGSLCQNTPQMSPNVSDVDEGIGPDLAFTEEQILGVQVPKVVPTAESISASGSGTLIMAEDGDCSQKIIILRRDSRNMHQLDVDERISLAHLKKWLSERLGLDSAQFVITKHHSDELEDKGYECTARDTELVKDAFHSVNWLSIQFRPPLKENEKMIRIMRFDLEDPNRENWKPFFDVPASQRTFIGDILLKCQRLYREIYGQHLELSQIRLRDMAMNQRPVLNLDATLESRSHSWTNNIYMQIITDERVLNAPGIPILVRRFRPSTVESSAIHEVLIDESSAAHPFAALRQSISLYSGIPLDRVEITEPPKIAWDMAKWPYIKPRLELLDGNVPFVKKVDSTANYIERIGSRVLYYRDSEEKAKELTEDERKTITIKDNAASPNTAATRRKERPLRIQMSSISEP